MRTVVAAVQPHRRRSSTIAGGSFQPGEVNNAIETIKQKKISASAACAVDTAGGRKNRTVTPPRMPCAITAPNAAAPVRRTQPAVLAVHNQTTSTTVRKPTPDAMSRCPCSYKMLATHIDGGNVNMFQPYVVGQSGTERPAPLLVTRLPARISRTVQPARNFA